MGPRGGKMLASNILQRANDLGGKKTPQKCKSILKRLRTQ